MDGQRELKDGIDRALGQTVFVHQEIDPAKAMSSQNWDHLEIEKLPDLTKEEIDHILRGAWDGD